jgi:hypothetical protein
MFQIKCLILAEARKEAQIAGDTAVALSLSCFSLQQSTGQC